MLLYISLVSLTDTSAVILERMTVLNEITFHLYIHNPIGHFRHRKMTGSKLLKLVSHSIKDINSNYTTQFRTNWLIRNLIRASEIMLITKFEWLQETRFKELL